MSEGSADNNKGARLDRYLLALGAFATVVIAAEAIGSGIRHSTIGSNPQSDTDRWKIHSEYSGGWNVFDSATGEICSVPNGSIPGQQINCSGKPR